MAEIHDQPSEVTAEAGSVVVDGPGGVAVTLTPQAAHDTGGRLVEAAAEARTQPVATGFEDDGGDAS